METYVNTYQEQSLIIEYLLKEYSIVNRTTEIRDYYSKIQNVFHEIKKKYPAYFSRLFFDENGHSPYSEDLDSIIQDFQVSGKIGKQNPEFNTLLIKDIDLYSVESKMKEELPDVNVEEIKNIVDSLRI